MNMANLIFEKMQTYEGVSSISSMEYLSRSSFSVGSKNEKIEKFTLESPNFLANKSMLSSGSSVPAMFM